MLNLVPLVVLLLLQSPAGCSLTMGQQQAILELASRAVTGNDRGGTLDGSASVARVQLACFVAVRSDSGSDPINVLPTAFETATCAAFVQSGRRTPINPRDGPVLF